MQTLHLDCVGCHYPDKRKGVKRMTDYAEEDGDDFELGLSLHYDDENQFDDNAIAFVWDGKLGEYGGPFDPFKKDAIIGYVPRGPLQSETVEFFENICDPASVRITIESINWKDRNKNIISSMQVKVIGS